MEKGRRKSSASEFFSRRHSSSLFQSMRRYSTSTMFGTSEEKSPGRRHSSTQLPLSISERESPSRVERWRSLARVVLGDVQEQQETDPCCNEEPGQSGGLELSLCWRGCVRIFCVYCVFLPISQHSFLCRYVDRSPSGLYLQRCLMHRN